MVLVVGSPRDWHVRRVMDGVERRRREATFLDLAGFPGRSRLSLRYGAGRPERRVVDGSGRELRLDEARAIFWRRPEAIRLPPGATPDEREFAVAQWTSALAGVWQALDARWVNSPSRAQLASCKTLQLQAAAEAGFVVPRTLVTSDPDTAGAFVAELGGPENVVRKHLEATGAVARMTERASAEPAAQLRQAPAILQEYVPAEVDLRVSVVGDRVLAASIDARDTSYPLDWRRDYFHARVEPAVLPDDVTRSTLALMRRLDLVYGALDLRRKADGEHVFLELNPSGRWLFIEQATRLPITDAVADLLASA